MPFSVNREGSNLRTLPSKNDLQISGSRSGSSPINYKQTQNNGVSTWNTGCTWKQIGLVQIIAWFLGVFGINTASDISKFTKISRAVKWRVIFGEF